MHDALSLTSLGPEHSREANEVPAPSHTPTLRYLPHWRKESNEVHKLAAMSKLALCVCFSNYNTPTWPIIIVGNLTSTAISQPIDQVAASHCVSSDPKSLHVSRTFEAPHVLLLEKGEVKSSCSAPSCTGWRPPKVRRRFNVRFK